MTAGPPPALDRSTALRVARAAWLSPGQWNSHVAHDELELAGYRMDYSVPDAADLRYPETLATWIARWASPIASAADTRLIA